jgi:hypothetical protein
MTPPPHGLFHVLFHHCKHSTHTCHYGDNVERAKKLRVQLHALIERCSCDGAEVIAKGLAARGRHPNGALTLPSRIRGGGGEAIRWSGNIFHSSRVLVRPVFCLRVQLLIDRLAAEDRGGFLFCCALG